MKRSWRQSKPVAFGLCDDRPQVCSLRLPVGGAQRYESLADFEELSSVKDSLDAESGIPNQFGVLNNEAFFESCKTL